MWLWGSSEGGAARYATLKSFLTKTHEQRSRACEFILDLPDQPYVVTVDEPTRTIVRSAHLHAVISDIADQKLWDGDKLSIEDWKRLLTAAWMRATGRKVKIVRAVDGTGIDVLYQRTSLLSEAECRELIQFAYAWGVENGVKFKEPDSWRG